MDIDTNVEKTGGDLEEFPSTNNATTPIPEFLTLDPPVEGVHPFTVLHVLERIFNYLDMYDLHNVRLVTKSKKWQDAATTELLRKGTIRRPKLLPWSGPLRSMRKCLSIYTAALQRLLSKCPLVSTPFITIGVANSTELDFYKERNPILLSRVGGLIYGKGENLKSRTNIVDLATTLEDLPNVEWIKFNSWCGLVNPSTQRYINEREREQLEWQLGKLSTKLKRLKKLILDYELSSKQLNLILEPYWSRQLTALTWLTFGVIEWDELKGILEKFVRVNPPWPNIMSVNLAIIKSSESLAGADYSALRQFLLHLEQNAKLKMLALEFLMPPGRNNAADGNLRLGFALEDESADWEEDNWLLPVCLTQLTLLQLRAVIMKKEPEERSRSGETTLVPPEMVRTLVTALRLPNLATLNLSIANTRRESSCSWAQMLHVAQSKGQPCPSLRQLALVQEGRTNDCPFFPAHLWPNLISLQVQFFKCDEFHGVNFLRSIWPQYIGLTTLCLRLEVRYSIDLIADLSEVLWGKKWPDSTVNKKESIVNLKKLKTLIISGKIPRQYVMTDFAIYNGLDHMKNLQRLDISLHGFTPAAMDDLKKSLGPRVHCKMRRKMQKLVQ